MFLTLLNLFGSFAISEIADFILRGSFFYIISSAIFSSSVSVFDRPPQNALNRPVSPLRLHVVIRPEAVCLCISPGVIFSPYSMGYMEFIRSASFKYLSMEPLTA